MKIIIDFLVKLTPEFEEYRLNLFRELVKIKELEVFVAVKDKHTIKANGLYKMVFFKKGFHWEKDNETLKKIKPDGLLLFSKPDQKLMRRYPSFIVLGALLKEDLFQLQESKLKDLLAKLKLARGLIVRTKFTQVYLANHFNIEKSNVYAIGQGVEDQFFKHNITDDIRIVRQVLSIYRVSKPYIFVSGRLSQKPNLDKVLEVFAGIYQKHPDLKLLIASTDFDIGWDNKPKPLTKKAEEILELCEKYRIARKVVFTGLIDRDHMPIILDNAELVLHLEEKRNISKSLLEALAVGVPLVINDSPVFKELAGNAALITTPKVTTGVINAVQLILENEGERTKLQKKAITRSEYFKWEAVANRLAEYMLLKNKVKQKESLLFLTSKISDQDTTFQMFEKLYKFSKDHLYNYTIGPRKLLRLVKLIRSKEYLIVNEDLNLSMTIYITFLKVFARNVYTIGFLESECGVERKKNIFLRFANFIQMRQKGIYLKIIYKKILITNPFCIAQYSKYFKIDKEKFQYLPFVFDKKLDKSKSVKLRNSARLKNYLCITARIDDVQTFHQLYEIVNNLYEEFQEFKVLVIKDPSLKLDNEGGKKIQKRFMFFSEDESDEVLLNSKIYFDFREHITQKELLTAMKTRNCCIVKSTLPALYLVKPGINGYIYSSLETDKIQKQIAILFNNKLHLNDIRKINGLRADVFSKENVEESLKTISEKWS